MHPTTHGILRSWAIRRRLAPAQDFVPYRDLGLMNHLKTRFNPRSFFGDDRHVPTFKIRWRQFAQGNLGTRSLIQTTNTFGHSVSRHRRLMFPDRGTVLHFAIAGIAMLGFRPCPENCLQKRTSQRHPSCSKCRRPAKRNLGRQQVFFPNTRLPNPAQRPNQKQMTSIETVCAERSADCCGQVQSLWISAVGRLDWVAAFLRSAR